MTGNEGAGGPVVVIPEKKARKNSAHFTLRVPYEFMEAVREFKRLAKEKQKDSSRYILELLEQGVTKGLEALKQEDAA